MASILASATTCQNLIERIVTSKGDFWKCNPLNMLMIAPRVSEVACVCPYGEELVFALKYILCTGITLLQR